MNNNPIGILDSGLGGLTVWKEIVHLLPHESTVYLGDSQNAPYGARSSQEIYALTKRLINFLLEKKVKLIVLACNTITVSCLEKLREEYPQIPIVGTVPVIKTAAEVTRNKRIGVLSTTRTAASSYQKELIAKFAQGCSVFTHGTDDLVPLIEAGNHNAITMDATLKNVLKQFLTEKVDTLVLGSTHFPFLKEMIQTIMGEKVQVLDSGGAIARQVKRILEYNSLIADSTRAEHVFYTTGNSQIANKLLHSTIENEKNDSFSTITI